MLSYADTPAALTVLPAAGDDATTAPATTAPATTAPVPVPVTAVDRDLAPLLGAVYDDATTLWQAPAAVPGWRCVLVRDHAPASHYDLLVALLRRGVALPDGVACVARTGSGMHGFRGRPWAAHAGNIHLVVHFAPQRPVDRFDAAFTALAAVSAAEAAATAAGLAGRVGIKWVNDVIVAGCKVGGVLAYTQTRDADVTSVVLGIGLNVETTPAVPRSPEVPAVSSLAAVAAREAGAAREDGATVRAAPVLAALLAALRRNYDTLLHAGAAPLVDAYRQRSTVIGRQVRVLSDDGAGTVLAAGRVTGIGDGLELHVEGHPPLRRGRVVVDGAPGGEDRVERDEQP
jgi:biotin-[acetyl-CoA-carboxylase] ligase BirA-like protein